MLSLPARRVFVVIEVDTERGRATRSKRKGGRRRRRGGEEEEAFDNFI